MAYELPQKARGRQLRLFRVLCFGKLCMLHPINNSLNLLGRLADDQSKHHTTTAKNSTPNYAAPILLKRPSPAPSAKRLSLQALRGARRAELPRCK